MTCDAFADPALLQLCLATEEARTAASAAQKAAEAPDWIAAAGPVIDWILSFLPWIALAGLFAITWPTLRKRLADGAPASFKVGNVEVELGPLKKQIQATALDLSYDLMDVSTVLEQGLNWPDWQTFKPTFTDDGLVLLDTSRQRGAVLLPAVAEEERARRELAILWVDDQPKLTDYRVRFLRRRGYMVSVARTTEDALKRIAQRDYDCIITDATREGDPDAWADVLKKIRGEDVERGRDATPFVVQTSPKKAQTLMSPPSRFRTERNAFATFSFTLIRHRLRWLEDPSRPNDTLRVALEQE